jgi:hypothetical protein
MKTYLVAIALLVAGISTEGIAQTYVTSDSDLNGGKPSLVTYNAPGKSSPSAQVISRSDSKDILWNILPDPWGLTSGSGTINVGYSGEGVIKAEVHLAGLNKAPVDAYPFVGYGADVFGYSIHGQPLRFPAELSSMKSLIFDTSYELSGTFTGNIDILFDEWLMPATTYSGGGKGAVEVEIFGYYDFATGLFGKPVRTFTAPATLNGEPTNLSFLEYASKIGAGGGSIVLFYPKHQMKAAELRFDALLFLKEAADTAKVGPNWLVPGFDLGTEFGESATEDYTFTVKKVKIEQTMAESEGEATKTSMTSTAFH